jgi:hypothetical protein
VALAVQIENRPSSDADHQKIKPVESRNQGA